VPVTVAADRPLALSAPARARLTRHVGEGIADARRSGGQVLVAVTDELDPTVDPCAVAFASREDEEPYFCLEQPDHAGAALSALGSVATLEDHGARRFQAVAERWRELVADARADDPGRAPGTGLVAVGGFAFAPEGGDSEAWSGFAAASLHVPQVALARRDGQVHVTLATRVAGDDLADQVVAAMQARLGRLRRRPLPLLDPEPLARPRVGGALAPEHYEAAVARAVERIRAGDLEKVVLAREVSVHAGADLDAAAVFGVLRDAFASCFTFCVGRGPAAFLAASPELLIRREGMRVSTLALAGSTRRSADPAVDDHLGEALLRSDKDRGEQAIVTRRIERTLREDAVWVAAAPEPVLVRVANIQHLATPIRAQLAAPVGVIELLGRLHPTPAVGGEPWAVAEALIPALEGMDRGWYAGPVGWVDAVEDGEFCVALRCALLRGREARCYAGVGVVADSDPQAELAETEVKLAALLPVLAG